MIDKLEVEKDRIIARKHGTFIDIKINQNVLEEWEGSRGHIPSIQPSMDQYSIVTWAFKKRFFFKKKILNLDDQSVIVDGYISI